MTYEELLDFVQNRMRMSHVYQPVMIMTRRAQFHCELCGISADIKALEADHIIPRNHGGSDDPSNLQALCYSCNAMKRDKRLHRFSQGEGVLLHREDTCLFCTISTDALLLKTSLPMPIRGWIPSDSCSTPS